MKTEIDFLILTDNDGGEARLTNQTPSARYGIPCLSINARDLCGAFGPADLLGTPPQCFFAADVGRRWGSEPDRTPAERQAAGLFLRQWPDGPQLEHAAAS